MNTFTPQTHYAHLVDRLCDGLVSLKGEDDDAAWDNAYEQIQRAFPLDVPRIWSTICQQYDLAMQAQADESDARTRR